MGTIVVSEQFHSMPSVVLNNASSVPPGTSLTIYPMVDGDEYKISDGAEELSALPLTGADFGSPVIGGGTQHCKVRWNAQTLAWTLCGL